MKKRMGSKSKKETRGRKIPRSEVVVYAGVVLSVLACFLFAVSVSYYYSVYKVSGVFALPRQLILIVNVFAVVGLAMGVYSLARKGNKQLSLLAVVLGLAVLLLPFLLSVF